MNNGAINICTYVFTWIYVFTSLDIHLGEESLDCMAIVQTPEKQPVFQSGIPFYISSNTAGGF